MTNWWNSVGFDFCAVSCLAYLFPALMVATEQVYTQVYNDYSLEQDNFELVS